MRAPSCPCDPRFRRAAAAPIDSPEGRTNVPAVAEKSKDKTASEKAPDDEREDEASEEETSEEEEESEDEADDDDASDEESDDDEPKGERDASTRGVAKALGVDGDEASDDEEDDDAPKAEAKPNRAQRRRDEAAKRRAAREGAPTKPAAKTASKDAVPAKDAATEEDAEPAKPLPRDKNARAKELLRRRQESAMGKRVSKLETAEVVQDRLARASSAVGGFLKQNFRAVAAVLVLGLGGAIGVSIYFSHQASVAAKRSDDLNRGVLALRGRISAKPDPNYDPKKELLPLYTTLDARADAALTEFAKVSNEHKGSGAATLAKLGEGTALLDKRNYDGALAAFNEVIGSQLAAADADVKGRALEGAGYAKEGLEKWDEAIEFFKQLEALKGMEDLGKYHRARMLLKSGNVEDAKTALLELQKKLEIPSPDAPNPRLLSSGVDSALRQIDPTLVKKRAPTLGGMRGNTMTADQLKDLDDEQRRKLIERMLKDSEHGGPGPNAPVPIPGGDPEP